MVSHWYHFLMAMTLRLSEKDEQILEDISKKEGVSKQEATARAIREYARRRNHEDAVEASSQKVRERYADVLRRLGE